MNGERRHRLIALGASNLTRGFLTALDVARGDAAGPLQVFAALGRGRSYGLRSSLLGRGLPGIRDCGLWRALPTPSPATTTALVMDVGNDILYGVEPAQILAWIDEALTALRPHACRRIVAGLPMHVIAALGPLRYLAVRSVLVPGCRLSLPTVQARADVVENGLRELARRHDAAFVALRPEWYGFDPVHFRRRDRGAAFAHLLGCDPRPPRRRLDRPWERLRWQRARPERCTWLGREVATSQPARRWRDGTEVSLF
ncbi:MAG: SGNH/GDSL hydrolase family protein [Planctomycetes bacterium]|nr:SGNH/GDSL hydrolase family protein [Planctomycetota bacterium]